MGYEGAFLRVLPAGDDSRSANARDGFDGFCERLHIVLGVAAVNVLCFVSDQAHPEVLWDPGVRKV